MAKKSRKLKSLVLRGSRLVLTTSVAKKGKKKLRATVKVSRKVGGKVSMVAGKVGTQMIDYGSLTGDEKRQKAMNDIRSYLGDKMGNIELILVKGVVDTNDWKVAHQFAANAAWAGVRGYPAIAWWETLFEMPFPEKPVVSRPVSIKSQIAALLK